MQQQIHNGQLVTCLMKALLDGERSLSNIPLLVKRIIKDEMWGEFYVDRTKQTVTHAPSAFVSFVTAQPMEGLGTSIEMLKRICAEDKEALDLIDQATQEKHGGDRKSKRIKGENPPLETRKTRDRSTKHLRRIRKDFPEIHKGIVNGKTSVSVASVQAGIQARRVSINLQSPDSAARTIINMGGSEYAMQVINALKAELKK
jgi:hypothetical protein